MSRPSKKWYFCSQILFLPSFEQPNIIIRRRLFSKCFKIHYFRPNFRTLLSRRYALNLFFQSVMKSNCQNRPFQPILQPALIFSAGKCGLPMACPSASLPGMQCTNKEKSVCDEEECTYGANTGGKYKLK